MPVPYSLAVPPLPSFVGNDRNNAKRQVDRGAVLGVRAVRGEEFGNVGDVWWGEVQSRCRERVLETSLVQNVAFIKARGQDPCRESVA